MFSFDMDYEGLPWELIIRARSIFELDALFGAFAIDKVGEVGSDAAVRQVAAIVEAGLARSPEGQLAAEDYMARVGSWASTSADDDTPFCLTRPGRFGWPPKKFGDFSELSSPLLRYTTGVLARFARLATSPEFAGSVVDELINVGQAGGRG